jgi:hypothetical protein
MIPIIDLIQTCEYCPSQWEFYTFENRPVYIRFRWGSLSIEIGDQNAPMENAVDGFVLYDDVQLSHENDGNISWDKVKSILDTFDEEEIKLKLNHLKRRRK